MSIQKCAFGQIYARLSKRFFSRNEKIKKRLDKRGKICYYIFSTACAHSFREVSASMKKNSDTELIVDEMSDKIIATTSKLVTEFGTQYVTVRKILNEMNISNRVFYNRFHNLDEVLQAVYLDFVIKMRGNFQGSIPEDMDFFEYVTHVIVKCMIDTYDMRRQFSQYTFEHNSLTEQNRIWWIEKITNLLEEAKERGIVRKDIDSEAISYFAWCVCRGVNADAVARKLSKTEAVEYLKIGFRCILDGIKA